MRLPYKKSFQGLNLVGLATECCHVTKGGLVRVYFQLSEPPPLGWAYIFSTVWRSLAYAPRRLTGVERDTVWIDCKPEEVAACHLRQLEYAVAQTCSIYRQEAQEQAVNAVRQAQLRSQLRSQLEELNQALYPAAEPRSQDRSILAKLRRFIGRGGRQNQSRPVRGGAVSDSLGMESLRHYHHSRFEGAAMAPDGPSLLIDYFDHDQGGTRYCFRYVISVNAPPRLVSGYTHEDSRLDYEIPFERIPRHVFSEARDWLTAHIAAQRDKPGAKCLTELLEYLKERENAGAYSKA